VNRSQNKKRINRVDILKCFSSQADKRRQPIDLAKDEILARTYHTRQRVHPASFEPYQLIGNWTITLRPVDE
jgi:hypothetical protein